MGALSQTTMQLNCPFGTEVGVALCLLLLLLAVVDARQVWMRCSGGARIAAMTLRCATVFLASALIMQPQWATREAEARQGAVAVVMDVSRSMALSTDGGQTRTEVAQAIAKQIGDEFPLAEGFLFGDTVRAADLDALSVDYPARDGKTQIFEAVKEVVEGAGEPLGAVVLVSDGAESGERIPVSAFRELGVRVHVVAVGARAANPDVAITSVKADAAAFLRQQAEVEVELHQSPAQGGTVPVTLRKGGELVAEVSAQLDSRGRGKVVIPFDVRDLGRAVYTVHIPVHEGDSVPENNVRSFLMNVSRERMRVLLVCGRPGWDSHFLRSFLKGRPSIDLISFFILRTANDMSMASPDELSLIPFPTDELFREHLHSFDLVVFQDFNYGPYQMARYLPRVADYVKKGGSFAMLGGELSFGPGGYANTPIAEILPVELNAVGPGVDVQSFKPMLASHTASHPLVSLVPDAQSNARLWQDLAPLAGSNVFGAPRPGSAVLLEHPTLPGAAPGGESSMPVLVIGQAGQGRTLALSVDSSYRWGFTTAGTTGDSSVYERFWDRAIRWLTHDPLLEPSRIDTDAESYAPGTTVRVEMLLRGPDYRALAEGSVRLELRSGHGRRGADLQGDVKDVQDVDLRVHAGGYTAARVEAPESPGAYQLVLLHDDRILAEQAFVVEIGGEELSHPLPDPERLAAIADATGGEFFNGEAPKAAGLERTTMSFVAGRTLMPLSFSTFFIAFAASCFAEWALRRRLGLR